MKTIAILKTTSSNKKTLEEAEAFLKSPVVLRPHDDILFYVQVLQDRIQLVKIPGPNPIEVDFLSPKWKFKSKTLSKSQPLFKAIGLAKDLPRVLDATAGLGEDTFSFLSKGCSVTALEKNPIIYLLLKNGFDRLKKDEKWGAILSEKFNLFNVDALDFMKASHDKFDTIYIDPMYSDASGDADPKKEMMLLRELLPAEETVELLLSRSLKVALNRVVIKRPLRSNYLSLAPTHSFKGRSTRYDMYSSKL